MYLLDTNHGRATASVSWPDADDAVVKGDFLMMQKETMGCFLMQGAKVESMTSSKAQQWPFAYVCVCVCVSVCVCALCVCTVCVWHGARSPAMHDYMMCMQPVMKALPSTPSVLERIMPMAVFFSSLMCNCMQATDARGAWGHWSMARTRQSGYAQCRSPAHPTSQQQYRVTSSEYLRADDSPWPTVLRIPVSFSLSHIPKEP